MEAKLVIVAPENLSGEYNLKLPVTIGRGREAKLKLLHPLVSRLHCELFEADDGGLAVRDLGSLNGTFVGGDRVTEAAVPPGELLTIGTVTFQAVYGEQPAAAAAPQDVGAAALTETESTPDETFDFAGMMADDDAGAADDFEVQDELPPASAAVAPQADEAEFLLPEATGPVDEPEVEADGAGLSWLSEDSSAPTEATPQANDLSAEPLNDDMALLEEPPAVEGDHGPSFSWISQGDSPAAPSAGAESVEDGAQLAQADEEEMEFAMNLEDSGDTDVVTRDEEAAFHSADTAATEDASGEDEPIEEKKEDEEPWSFTEAQEPAKPDGTGTKDDDDLDSFFKNL